METDEMATKRKPAARKPTDDVELRRWCIEQASHWPVLSSYGAGMSHTMANYGPERDADLIGRAKKILRWVTA